MLSDFWMASANEAIIRKFGGKWSKISLQPMNFRSDNEMINFEWLFLVESSGQRDPFTNL